ncbi:hypothetical protein J6590_099765 [Homalodisca vitripennis]|nr:hypothetical protein J6590_099765 [Homalodisca vitripennis]
MATPPPAEFFRQKDVIHEYCGITTDSPSLNQCSVRQITSGARAHDKQCSDTLSLTLLIFWWYMLNPSPFLPAAATKVDDAVGLPSTGARPQSPVAGGCVAVTFMFWHLSPFSSDAEICCVSGDSCNVFSVAEEAISCYFALNTILFVFCQYDLSEDLNSVWMDESHLKTLDFANACTFTTLCLFNSTFASSSCLVNSCILSTKPACLLFSSRIRPTNSSLVFKCMSSVWHSTLYFFLAHINCDISGEDGRALN